jgi:hypothetical protein
MRRSKKILLSCGIPLLLIGALFLWLYAWSLSWEKRWQTFRQKAEAEGESFIWSKDLGSAKEEQDNFFRHPWVEAELEKPSRVREVELRRTNEILSEIRELLPSEEEAEDAVVALFSESLRAETMLLLGKYENDLASLTEAAARGGCLQRYENYEAMLGNDHWSKIGTWQSLLGLRCWYRRETGDRSGMESDVATVMRLRDHASKQHAALPMLVGRGMLGMVVQLARYDLSAVDVSIEQKRFWAKYFASPAMTWEEECLETMRQERNGFLDVMDGFASGKLDFPTDGIHEELGQKNIFVRRVLLVRNRLALCEDFQETLAGPALRKNLLQQQDFEDFVRKVKMRDQQESAFERMGLMPWLMLGNIYGGGREQERKREELLGKVPP